MTKKMLASEVEDRGFFMYPYKEEILSSMRAFCLAWLMIITPILGFITVQMVLDNVYRQPNTDVKIRS